MKRETRRLIDEETQFGVSEMFFSTTDRKGIISSCNDVFVRISGYESSELLGKPHNCIRHPDMPRCVFALLWKYLLADKPIGAYVKNLSKSGKYYWVFALASPCSEGFISVRIKPTSQLLPVVKGLYPELLQLEESFGNDWRTGMEASTEELLRQLRALGFESYVDFMQTALRKEMLAGNAFEMPVREEEKEQQASAKKSAKKKGLTDVFKQLDHLMTLQQSLRQKEDFFLTLGDQITSIAINASIRAAHLGENGRSLSVISDEIARVSSGIEKESHDVKDQSTTLIHALGDMSFFIAQAILQSRMIDFFNREAKQMELTPAEQRGRFGKEVEQINKLLEVWVNEALTRCTKEIGELKSSLRGFDMIAGSLERVLMVIQFSYVTGRTLTARIDGAEMFCSLLDEMLSLANSARNELVLLKGAVGEVRTNVEEWSVSAS